MLALIYSFSFLRLTLSPGFSQSNHPENYAVSPVWVAQETKNTIPEFLQITIVLINRESFYKNELF